MNPYLQNLNRIEFVITYACTGRCKHCSEGDRLGNGEYIAAEAAAKAVKDICRQYHIESLMTFGGEPLLRPEVVCRIHKTAREMNIPKRQLITNGYFCKDNARIVEVAKKLAESGVNDILLSVDAFHQERIPLEPVKIFAKAVQETGISLRMQPAWLVSAEDDNAYNRVTKELLKEFVEMGIAINDGNVIFPKGNALKYLGDFFDPKIEYTSPYEDNPEDMRTASFLPNGDVLGGNIYQKEIGEIIESYYPVR